MFGKRAKETKPSEPKLKVGDVVWLRLRMDDEHLTQGTVDELFSSQAAIKLGTGLVIAIPTGVPFKIT